MLQSKKLKIAELETHFSLSGSPQLPPAVFLPGWGARPTGPGWLNGTPGVTQALGEHYYVVTVESPGFQRSQTPLHPWGLNEYAQHLRLLLKALKIDKPILIGNSFGGGIATAYAQLYPLATQALVLIDSVVSSKYPTTEYVRNLHQDYTDKLISSSRSLWLKKFDIWSYLGTPISHISPLELQRKVAMVRAAAEHVFEVDYSAINLPVLLLWGEQDLQVHPLSYAQEIVKLLPHGKLITYRGNVGTIYRQPQKIAALIQQQSAFLNQTAVHTPITIGE